MHVKTSSRPGPSFSRPGSILFPKDRLLYQVLADQAAPVIEKIVDRSRSFSHWLKGEDAEEMFIPTRACWNEMQRALATHAKNDRWKYVVKLDVSNCFASVNLHTLVNFLAASGYSDPLVTTLENLLIHYTGTRSSRGLIQGIFPSDLFGNFYLAPIDQYLADAHIPSVRYVDDIYLFVTDLDDAERATRRVVSALRTYDLALNEAKSYVLPKNLLITEEPDLEELFRDAIEEVRQKLSEDAMVEDYGFQREFDEDSAEEEKEDTEYIELKATEALFSEIGRFKGNEEKIERFCLPLFAKARSKHAVAHVLPLLSQYPAMSQLYCAYLVKFVDDTEITKAIEATLLADHRMFDWQRMWMVATLIPAKAGSDELVKACLDVTRSSQYHEALRAICAIYVAKFGSFQRRQALFSEYGSLGYPYIQTAVLYGARFAPAIEKRNAIASWGPHSELHAPEFDFDGKEREILTRIRVQPIDGRPMIRVNFLGDPNDCFCAFDARQIGEDLPEMLVIRPTELVFDDDAVIGVVVCMGQNVGSKRAHLVLSGFDSKVQIQCLPEKVDRRWLSQPRREVAVLCRPCCRERNGLEFAERDDRIHAAPPSQSTSTSCFARLRRRFHGSTPYTCHWAR
jgi:hypothetical protein